MNFLLGVMDVTCEGQWNVVEVGVALLTRDDIFEVTGKIEKVSLGDFHQTVQFEFELDGTELVEALQERGTLQTDVYRLLVADGQARVVEGSGEDWYLYEEASHRFDVADVWAFCLEAEARGIVDRTEEFRAFLLQDLSDNGV